ncbi:SDR family oxidoreductase [Massilibacterium senegalense]|uniref:SDR family oxidoreductase n=1 Tax=Massilibacterium senegalense TaxID=1632858 RepID=UPI000784F189|nr:SDR family oxidoreductase [Massilibacterium senegalense]
MKRHAFITAGTKGLGRKVTEEFLRNGYSVSVNFRSDEEAAKQLLTDFKECASDIQLLQGDVTKKEDCKKMMPLILNRFGRIDCLINNAGPYIFERKKLADYEDEEWEEMISGNLSGVFYLFKEAIPYMRKQKYGRIITYGFQGAQGAPAWIHRSAFAAAKVGLVSLTKTIAIEEAKYGVTANMVCPGNIVGAMKEATIGDARLIQDEHTPVGRSGTGEDIARMVAFLCHEDSDMVTGSVVEVTGGIDVIHRYRS